MDPPSDNLYMKGLPAGCTEETLRALFGGYGTVVSVKILPTPAGVGDCAALCRMSQVTEAQFLVDNAATIGGALGTNLLIKFAANAKGKGKGKEGGGGGGGGFVQGGLPSTRLYMKGLPLGITEDQLRQVIGAYGQVASCKVLPTPPAGAPDSACIVQMNSPEEAKWIVENLDGNIPQGLSAPLQIRYKQDTPSDMNAQMAGMMGQAQMGGMMAQVPMQAMGGGMGGGGGGDRGNAPSDNVYIKGLPTGCTEEIVKTVFGVYGTVVSCKILPPPPGKSDTACLCRLATVEEATWLVENLNGNIPQGLTEPVGIRYADNPKGQGKGKAGGMDGMTSQINLMQGGAAATQWSPLTGMGKGAGGFGGGGNNEPSDNLYMKGLPDGTTEDMLKQIFGAYGTVASVRVLQSPPGVNDVAALVRMGDATMAQWLVENVNGNIPEGLVSPVMIKFASNNSKGGKDGGKGFGGGMGGKGDNPFGIVVPGSQVQSKGWTPSFGGGDFMGGKGGKVPDQPSDNLYIKGFPDGTDELMLRTILSPYGNIQSVKVLQPPPGKTQVAALVRMGSLDEAKWLVENMNGNIPEGQAAPLEVRFAANSGKGGGKGDRVGPY